MVVIFRNNLPMPLSLASVAMLATLTFGVPSARGDNSESAAFFEKKIRPLLVEHCLECHSEDAAESDLRLDSLAGMLRGGERGPAIVPGKVDQSLLISAVRHGELLKMPPKRKLAAADVAALEQWVLSGSHWPNAVLPADVSRSTVDQPSFTPKQRDHWSYQAPRLPAVPAIDHPWIQSPIDAFVWQRRAVSRLVPAPRATKAQLIRRVTFDLLGVPPTPDEVDRFLSDDSPDAFARLVDRLLGSPRYGQRWGRHWLDVARYADSNGLDENLAYANAYRYRDYVIAAMNGDRPYDEFVREQLAGDLLPASGDEPTDLQRLVATGFLSLGAKMLAEDDPVKMQMDIVDEQIDTMGRVFLGQTLGCARCHDHKFDPVSTRDYYALAGIFKSTRTMETHTVVARWMERPLAEPAVVQSRNEQQARIKELERLTQEEATKATQMLFRATRRHVAHYLLAVHRRHQFDQLVSGVPPMGQHADAASRPGVIVLEAERYVRGNVTQDFATYGKDIGVLVNRGELPNYAEYEVEVPAAGLYQVELRYAAAGSRPTLLQINGELVKANAAAEVTGSWNPDGQRWYIEGFFSFRRGPNVVRLEQPQFFPHIDKILIAPAPPEAADLAGHDASADHVVLPELVESWRGYLKKQQEVEASLFAAWQDLSLDGQLDPVNQARNPLVTGVLGNDAPRTVAELARRYGELFSKAADELDAEVASESASSPEPADPVARAVRQVLQDPQGPFAQAASLEKHFPEATLAQLRAWSEERKQLEEKLPKLPEAMAVAEVENPSDVPVHIRGSHLTLGAVVPRGVPEFLASGSAPAMSPGHSGRKELADWLTSRENPLTARVIVNRIWQWHFGAGLVRSPDNFGLLGETPTHPELLDWLARQFIESGWSIKKLHRLMLLSSTYQMSSEWNAAAAEQDPDNVLLWRYAPRRLEAEAVRDAILAASGQLDESMGGTLLPTANRAYVTSTANVNPVVYDSRRRSVYLPVVRSALYEMFQAFDFADPSMSQGKREVTTVAPQAMFFLNSALVAQAARSLAEELLSHSTRNDEHRVDELFQRSLGRIATAFERARSIEYISESSRRFTEQASASREPGAQGAGEGSPQLRAWQSLIRAVWSSNEFVYVD